MVLTLNNDHSFTPNQVVLTLNNNHSFTPNQVVLTLNNNHSFTPSQVVLIVFGLVGCLMVFNATFNNSSVISWKSVLLVKETGVPVEKHQRKYM